MAKAAAKKVIGNPTVMVPANTGPNSPKNTKGPFPQPEFTKAEYMRVWFQDQPQGVKWKDVKNDIKETLTNAGHVFNENSDYLSFLRIGQEVGKIVKGEPKTKMVAIPKDKGMTLKRYAEMVEGMDAATLSLAIQIVTEAGSTAAAYKLSLAWAEMVEDLGEETARKALKYV